MDKNKDFKIDEKLFEEVEKKYQKINQEKEGRFNKILSEVQKPLEDYEEGYRIINVSASLNDSPISEIEASRLVNQICKDYNCKLISAVPPDLIFHHIFLFLKSVLRSNFLNLFFILEKRNFHKFRKYGHEGNLTPFSRAGAEYNKHYTTHPY